MERKKFIQNFSRRLVQLMKKGGYASNRSNTDVNIRTLSKVTGCSYQMARRYTKGLALPELYIVQKIAVWLNTSPSWLLFGENDSKLPNGCSQTAIEIEPELLKYILIKYFDLFIRAGNKAKLVNFIVDSIYDISHLNADLKTLHKIIDMMLSSAMVINSSNKEQRV